MKMVGLQYITSTCAHMWEEEMDVEGKSCWSRKECALSHHRSLKLDHQVYNVNSYEGILCKSKVLYIFHFIKHYHGG